jgi:hypothetical protein
VEPSDDGRCSFVCTPKLDRSNVGAVERCLRTQLWSRTQFHPRLTFKFLKCSILHMVIYFLYSLIIVMKILLISTEYNTTLSIALNECLVQVLDVSLRRAIRFLLRQRLSEILYLIMPAKMKRNQQVRPWTTIELQRYKKRKLFICND